MEVLAIIPARAGSKGVPGKNIRPLAGRPLVAHTIEHARAAPIVTRIVVSTDGAAIAQVASGCGAEVIRRPPAISGDTATSESALRHVLDTLREAEDYQHDLVVFLQCTSPIRAPDDIQRAVQTLLAEGADSLLSVTPSHRFLWKRRGDTVESINYDYRQRPRRQDHDPEFAENGSIYVFRPWVLLHENNRLGGRIALYAMGPWSWIDIDSLQDFALCEWVLEQL
ncbi:MAG: cytidylyltransferase domain-containing protein [Anaerolineae bacterium]